jgi:hypothetical protein
VLRTRRAIATTVISSTSSVTSTCGDFDVSDDPIIFNQPTHLLGLTVFVHRIQRVSSHLRNPISPRFVQVLTKLQPLPITGKGVSKASARFPWTCATCTLISSGYWLHSTTPASPRAAAPHLYAQTTDPLPTAGPGWTCGVCGERGMEHNFLTC